MHWLICLRGQHTGCLTTRPPRESVHRVTGSATQHRVQLCGQQHAVFDQADPHNTRLAPWHHYRPARGNSKDLIYINIRSLVIVSKSVDAVTNIGTVSFKGNTGGNNSWETGGGSERIYIYMGFPERIDTMLTWTELNWTLCLHATGSLVGNLK